MPLRVSLHTNDVKSIENMLKEAARKLFQILRARTKAVLFDPQTYWNERAKNYGKKAVLNIARNDSEMEPVTLYQKQTIFPLMQKYLNGNETAVLDFGCGPGRFTQGLAELIHGKAFGIDPVLYFIEMARKEDPLNEYKLSKNYLIPYPDNHFDVIWICLVLCIIQDKHLNKVIEEIFRVSKKNALLILTENTTDKSNYPHCYYRNATAYGNMFKGFSLKVEGEYEDMGERISIMIGRRI